MLEQPGQDSKGVIPLISKPATEQGTGNTSCEAALQGRSEEKLTTVGLAMPNSRKMLNVVYNVTYLSYAHKVQIFSQ